MVNVTVGEHRVPDRVGGPGADGVEHRLRGLVQAGVDEHEPVRRLEHDHVGEAGHHRDPSATGPATPIGAPSANSPRIVASPRHIRSAYSVSVSTRHHGKPGEDRLGTSRLLRPAVPDDGDRMLSRTSSDGLPRR